MSVSYHLIPVDKNTESFVDSNGHSMSLKNDFSLFAELMINFPDQFLPYFGKHELYFDFIFSLQKSEKSEITYQPENLKKLFTELLEILKTRNGFPIPSFNYFNFEDIMELTFLYAYIDGSELNKIVEEKSYSAALQYEISISFDKWNNYSIVKRNFEQGKTGISIESESGARFSSYLDVNFFPGVIRVNGTTNSINLGKEISEVSFVLKTPYEHLYPMFHNLIEVCDFCIERNYGIKSFVSY